MLFRSEVVVSDVGFLLEQFADKFQEVKEAAKLARDKSQEKMETSSNHSQVNTPHTFIHSAV